MNMMYMLLFVLLLLVSRMVVCVSVCGIVDVDIVVAMFVDNAAEASHNASCVPECGSGVPDCCRCVP